MIDLFATEETISFKFIQVRTKGRTWKTSKMHTNKKRNLIARHRCFLSFSHFDLKSVDWLLTVINKFISVVRTIFQPAYWYLSTSKFSVSLKFIIMKSKGSPIHWHCSCSLCLLLGDVTDAWWYGLTDLYQGSVSEYKCSLQYCACYLMLVTNLSKQNNKVSKCYFTDKSL